MVKGETSVVNCAPMGDLEHEHNQVMLLIAGNNAYVARARRGSCLV